MRDMKNYGLTWREKNQDMIKIVADGAVLGVLLIVLCILMLAM